VSPSVSSDAVRAYIMANQHDKVAALVKGFSVVPGKYAFALADVISHYVKLRTKTGDELSYHALKAMLSQGIQIYRVDDAMVLFRRFHDADAALELFDQVLASYTGKGGRTALARDDNGNEDENENNGKTRYLNFNIGKVINLTLQVLVENGRVADALASLSKMESQGLKTTQSNFVSMLSSMRKYLRSSSHKNQKKPDLVYDIKDFQMVLHDLKDRGLQVNRAVVGYLCPAYGSADKQQRLELLEAYVEARSDPNDTYILPHLCYETLLTYMAQEGDISEVKELYEEAVGTLNNKEKLGVPRGWLTVIISKLCRDGSIEEAEQLTKRMPEECGGYTYRAVMAVLRAALEAQKADTIDDMVALLGEREFNVGLSDAYELVHLAREKDLAEKALDIIRLFEKANLKEVAPAEDGQGNLEAAYVRRQRGDAHALRKVKTMYSVALKLCEKGGLWKQVLVLTDRMTTLLGQEAMAEIAATQKKHSQHKEQSSDPEE
jgi:pentatricopeptide repeat protein